MKKNTILLLLIAFLPYLTNAQKTTKPLCPFEKLFTVKAGMDMPSAVAQLQAYNQITLLKQVSEKLKPVSGAGDSILHETVTYSIDSSECIKGQKRTIQFEFADGKLFKALIESVYGSNELGDMMVNFDFLHKEILKQWKYEQSVKLDGDVTQGLGYYFYKTPDKKSKLDMCMLQYVKTSGSTPSNDKYTLEILWANLNDTRMEKTSF